MTVKNDNLEGLAFELSFEGDAETEAAFIRLSGSLPLVSEDYLTVAKALCQLSTMIKTHPQPMAKDNYSIEDVASDLDILCKGLDSKIDSCLIEELREITQKLSVPKTFVSDETEIIELAKQQFSILKSEVEQRTVLGIVLEPETVDSQDDIYSAEEVQKTAWKFLEFYQNFGFMHSELVSDILPLESYLAPVEFEMNGQTVKKGTWILRVRVLDDDIWEKVKSGELTGFSIGGSAIKTPDSVRLN